MDRAALLRIARELTTAGQDDAAKCALLRLLALDPGNFSALTELGALAAAHGDRAGARLAHRQAVNCHPGHPMGRVNLGDLLLQDGDTAGARVQYEAALAADPDFAEAHQGMARILGAGGDPAASEHRRRGYLGRATFVQRYNGRPPGVPLLLLVSVEGGNIPVRPWIDSRHFAVTGLYAEYHDAAQALPPHDLIVNAIGDASLGVVALAGALAVTGRSTAPVINPPDRVAQTGRDDNARRLGALPDVTTPKMLLGTCDMVNAAMLAEAGYDYPLLLRSAGFHNGQHFEYVASAALLGPALARLPPGSDVLVIQYLDARGADGMARKYRVMFIDGACYPLHLAIGPNWKLHYVTADMATSAAHRAEERRFLDDMPGVLGPRIMQALAAIATTLGLDYAGADFAVARDGALLLFEANATMALNAPDADPIWDYRRPAIAAATMAAARMLTQRHAASAAPCPA